MLLPFPRGHFLLLGICMSAFEKEITEIVNEQTEKFDVMLIEVSVKGSEDNPVIEVYIDNESGINADFCAQTSDAIKEQIESKNIVKDNYRLNVSSPGTDRPLKFLKQFPKHVGRTLTFVYTDSNSNSFDTEGELLSVNNDVLQFKDKNKQILEIQFNKLNQAKVKISF